MKYLILLTAILPYFMACKKTVCQNSKSSLIGKWQLSEYLADPGDGSGIWHSATSINPSYLEFKDDGKLTVLPYGANNWDHFQLITDSTIIFLRGSDQFIRWYHFSKTLLTISGGCIEACGDRYIPAQ